MKTDCQKCGEPFEPDRPGRRFCSRPGKTLGILTDTELAEAWFKKTGQRISAVAASQTANRALRKMRAGLIALGITPETIFN